MLSPARPIERSFSLGDRLRKLIRTATARPPAPRPPRPPANPRTRNWASAAEFLLRWGCMPDPPQSHEGARPWSLNRGPGKQVLMIGDEAAAECAEGRPFYVLCVACRHARGAECDVTKPFARQDVLLPRLAKQSAAPAASSSPSPKLSHQVAEKCWPWHSLRRWRSTPRPR